MNDDVKNGNTVNLVTQSSSQTALEDMLLRTVTEYQLGVPMRQETFYSSQLEEFIRKIVRDELAKVLKTVDL